MTSEQPTHPARPPRPGPAFRRAALGLPPEPTSGADRPGRTPPRRESLRDALARIPDLERGGAPVIASPLGSLVADRSPAAGRAPGAGGSAPGPAAPGRPAPAPGGDAALELLDDDEASADATAEGSRLRAMASRLLNGTVPADAELASEEVVAPAVPPAGPGGGEVDDADLFVSPLGGGTPPVPAVAVGGFAGSPVPELAADAPDWLRAAADEERATAARSGRVRQPVAPWRRAAFGAVTVLLLASIPVLGKIGYTLVTESKDGRFSSNVKSPTDPGYENEVVSTPTQLLVQKDAEGRPVAATVMSLSGVDGGGAVIFVPLQAEVRRPAFGVDRIIRAYDVLADRPPDGRKQVSVQVASLLNVGIDSVVEVDDRGWAQLVGPVAPLVITNPDPIEVGGEEIPSGEIELTADQVGPYLAATRPGETAFNALVRHELVWDAWISAVAASGQDDVVPGESTSGIGLFARELAAGPVGYSVVPTNPDDELDDLLRVDFTALDAIVLAAVPSPDPPLPGARATVRLLNGVSAEEIPAGIIQTVVQIGGSVSVIGNGPSFGRDETTIVYANPDNEGYAELLRAALGAGTARLDPEAEDSVALTVILGRDVIDDASVTTTTTDIERESGGS